MIKCVLISNIIDDGMRLKFLKKEHTLDEIVDIIRKKEDAEARNKVIEKEKDTENINKIRSRSTRDSQAKETSQKGGWKPGKLKEPCGRCGYELHPGGKCPAANEKCNYCKKKGHFGSVCFEKNKETKLIREEKEESDSSETDSEDGHIAAIEAHQVRDFDECCYKGSHSPVATRHRDG